MILNMIQMFSKARNWIPTDISTRKYNIGNHLIKIYEAELTLKFLHENHIFTTSVI